jgi:hypothetical protein
LNLRCEEKKIHFGNARIKKYHNTKQWFKNEIFIFVILRNLLSNLFN